MKRRNALQVLIAAGFPQILTACGGGSGDSKDTAPIAVAPAPVTPVPPPAPVATAAITAFTADKAEYARGLYPTLTTSYVGTSAVIDLGATPVQSGSSVQLAAPLIASTTARLTVKSATEIATRDLQLNVVSGLPKWRAALDRANAGGPRAKIACVGDSTTSGMGANIVSASEDSREKAYPQQLANVLVSKFGIRADASSIWGNGNASDISLFDPRIKLGAGWSIGDTFFAGGWPFAHRSDLPGFLSFKPSAPTDTLDIHYFMQPDYGTIEVSTNGIVHQSAQTAGAQGISKLTVKRNRSGSMWDIRKVTNTGSVVIVGLDAYDAASTNASVWNMGSSGSTIGTWMEGRFATVSPAVAPDLTIICLTINDWVAGTPSDKYNAGIQALIDTGKKTGDVLLMVGVPTRDGDAAPVSRQKVYADYIRTLASKNNLPLIDLVYSWKSQESLWEKGYYFDGMHPSAQGYLEIAATVADFIGTP